MVGVGNLSCCFIFLSTCKGPHVAMGVGLLTQVTLKLVGFREVKEAKEFEWSLALEAPSMKTGVRENCDTVYQCP